MSCSSDTNIAARKLNSSTPVRLPNKWWVGRSGRCSACGATIILEREDDHKNLFKKLTPSEIRTQCPNRHRPGYEDCRFIYIRYDVDIPLSTNQRHSQPSVKQLKEMYLNGIRPRKK